MVDFNEFTTNLENYHSDTKEMVSKLEDFCTDPVGDVTFELASGSTTISNLAKIQSNAYGSASRTAYDTLAQGDPIVMYNDAGTAKAKKMVAGSWGNANTIEAGLTYVTDGCFDSDEEEVISLQIDSGSNLDISSGSISGTSITWNSSQEISSSPSTLPSKSQIIFAGGDATASTLVIFYIHTGDGYIHYRVVTNNGSGSFTLGTDTALISEDCSAFHVSYDEDNNEIYIVYVYENAGTTYIKGNVLTVNGSGRSLSAGTPFSIEDDGGDGDTIKYPRCCFNSNLGTSGSICMVWNYVDVSLTPDTVTVKANVYDINSSSLGSAVSERLFNFTDDLGSIVTGDMVYDSENDIVYTTFGDENELNLNRMHLLKFHSEGVTSVSASNIVNFTSTTHAKSAGQRYKFDLENGKFYVLESQDQESYSTAYEYDLNYDECTFVSSHYLDASLANYGAITTDNNGKIIYLNQTQSTVKLPDERNKFVGFAEESIAVGNSGLCSKLTSSSSAFSGLTVGKKYYLKEDLSLTSVPTPFKIGIATDTDEILITG